MKALFSFCEAVINKLSVKYLNKGLWACLFISFGYLIAQNQYRELLNEKELKIHEEQHKNDLFYKDLVSKQKIDSINYVFLKKTLSWKQDSIIYESRLNKLTTIKNSKPIFTAQQDTCFKYLNITLDYIIEEYPGITGENYIFFSGNLAEKKLQKDLDKLEYYANCCGRSEQIAHFIQKLRPASRTRKPKPVNFAFETTH